MEIGGRLAAHISRIEIGLDPPIEVFYLVLETKRGAWHRSTGTENDLRIFLEGVQAGCAMMGQFFSLPEIPRSARAQVIVPPFENE
jgi:hypothetical protein